jgi:ligand-binding sensor domain-containing protein
MEGWVSTTFFQKKFAARGYLMGVAALVAQSENHLYAGLQQPDGNLALREFDRGRWEPRRLPKGHGPEPSVNTLFGDRQGSLWIGTASDGIFRITGGKIDQFSNAEGLASDSVVRFPGSRRHAVGRVDQGN